MQPEVACPAGQVDSRTASKQHQEVICRRLHSVRLTTGAVFPFKIGHAALGSDFDKEPLYLAWGWAEPGELALECMLRLYSVQEEFSPEKEYRIVLSVWTDSGREKTLEYYTCPLIVTEKGQT